MKGNEKGGINLSKEDILKNLYSLWGSKPLDHLFPGECMQFYSDLTTENITGAEYRKYARKQEGKK
jgi:hypothetical protein